MSSGGAPTRLVSRQPLIYVYVAAAIVVLWWAVAASGAVQAVLLPQPTAAFTAFGTILSHQSALANTVGATARSVLVAFLIAAPVGVLIGVVVGSRPVLSRALEPLLANLNAVPIVLLYPLLLGAFGSGAMPKIIVGALVATLPIAIATHWAERGLDQDLVTAAHSMGAGETAVVRSVVLPAITPGVFAGLRTGLGLAIVTVVAGKFLSSSVGLGYQLAQTREAFQAPELFAWLIVTIVFTAVAIGIMNVAHALLNRRINR